MLMLEKWFLLVCAELYLWLDATNFLLDVESPSDGIYTSQRYEYRSRCFHK